MKKIGKFLLPILALNITTLFGCKFKTDERVVLTYGNINQNFESFYERTTNDYAYTLTYQQLKEKIEAKKENFLLAVSPRTSCTCWTNLNAVVSNYVAKTHAIVYRISYDQLVSGNDTFSLTINAGGSTFAIFEAGVVRYCLCSESNPKELIDNNAFMDFMDKAATNPKIYSINEEDYFDILLNVPFNNAVVYIGRSGCGDCSSIEKDILIPYFNSNKSSNFIYYLDCQGYKDNLSSEEYQNKKEELCLTSASDQFGFDTGVFPTLYYIKDATIKAGAVAYNETLEASGNDFVVSNSYYTNDRLSILPYLQNFNGTKVLTGMTVSAENVSSNAYGSFWNKENSNKYYQPLINAFLDYSLPKANTSFIRKASN